jgi:hypothetical protein
MSTFKWLASIALSAAILPVLRAEPHCPGNVPSLRLRLVQRSQGNHDTLPIISTFPRELPSSVLAIRLKASRSTFLGRRIAGVDCISF